MKIYRYWKVEPILLHINGEEIKVTVSGGSNQSEEDASRNAQLKAEMISRKIKGEPAVFKDYEVEIREEILKAIRPDAIITRNRYGASVLNAENLLIMDIDKPKISFGGLFNRHASPKEKIYKMVRSQAKKYRDYGFRIYETFQGARVIVIGGLFNPRSGDTQNMMRDFNTDKLYALLCQKQACFRARLTPKPYRMKLRGHKFSVFNVRDAAEAQWLEAYERVRRNFSTCRFVEQVGANHPLDEVVRQHDEQTGAQLNLPLA